MPSNDSSLVDAEFDWFAKDIQPRLPVKPSYRAIMAKYAVPCTIFLVLIHARRCNNCMTEAVDSNTKTDSELLKRVSRMHEVGLSTKDITQQLGIDENTVKKVLQLLGYALAD